MSTPVVRLEGITKNFGPVRILQNISLDLQPGKISCLIGENGAGKTTLMKILMGIIAADAGTIKMNGELINHKHPGNAHSNGFRMVFQEPELVDHLTVLDNIYLNYEETKSGVFIDRQRMAADAKNVLEKLKCDFAIKEKAKNLTFSQKRKVCIARAAIHKPKVLILDEPTNSMVHDDVQSLFRYLYEFKNENTSIIYISHKLSESLLIADELIVLRDGKLIKQESQKQYNPSSLLTDITGDDLLNRYPKTNNKKDRTIFYTRNLSSEDGSIRNCGLSLRKGEIVGITGLQGAKKSTLGRALFGIIPLTEGKFVVNGKIAQINSPVDSIKHKIAFISEDVHENLDFNQSCFNNIIMPSLKKYSKGPLLNYKQATHDAFELLLKMNLRCSTKLPLELLNGGGLQKIMLAKWLNTDCEIFIFNEPTQNLDISSKIEFYNILNKMTSEDKSVILISSDFEEILGMSDKIIIMHEGQIINELANQNLTSKDLMRSASMYTETIN